MAEENTVRAPEELSRRETQGSLRQSKKRWRLFILIYTVIFLALGAVICLTLYRYCAAYEASLPEHVMDAYMARMTEEEWYTLILGGADVPDSAFEDTAGVIDAYYDAAVRGKGLSYRKHMAEYTDDTPVYEIRGGGIELALVRLRAIGSAGFGRSLWEVGETESILSLEHLESVSVEIDAPEGESVFLNGVELGEEYIVDTAVPAPDVTELELRFAVQPTYVRYRVEMFSSVTVTDKNGTALNPERDGSVVRYTVRSDSRYNVTVCADESITVSICGIELTPEDAAESSDGILAGLSEYVGTAAPRKLTYRFDGIYTTPEIVAESDGTPLTPLVSEHGEFTFFVPQDDALAEEMRPIVENYFSKYIEYSSKAYNVGRHHALMDCILPDTELYLYVRDSRDAMIWASATEVHYDELSFTDFRRISDDCFTCTIRYKADFAAKSWYESYTYDLKNAYEVAFVRSGNHWYAAAMSVIPD